MAATLAHRDRGITHSLRASDNTIVLVLNGFKKLQFLIIHKHASTGYISYFSFWQYHHHQTLLGQVGHFQIVPVEGYKKYNLYLSMTVYNLHSGMKYEIVKVYGAWYVTIVTALASKLQPQLLYDHWEINLKTLTNTFGKLDKYML